MDYHELPRLEDSISFIYAEHAIIEQDNSSLVMIQGTSRTPIPVTAVTCLLLGPGTSVTHAAMKTMAENGCQTIWCGESLGRYYANGMGETRSAVNILRQAELCMNEALHLEVAKLMYQMRFPKLPKNEYTLQQLRGMEGIRMREAYKAAASRFGVTWTGRNYKTTEWDEADPINQALSVGNAILYSVCQAAIVSLGYSTALGFVHTGKMLSFVYDIADLYKADTTIPAAFEAVKLYPDDLSAGVRRCCRKRFNAIQLLKRIPRDIEALFSGGQSEHLESKATGDLWTEEGSIRGGINYSDWEGVE